MNADLQDRVLPMPPRRDRVVKDRPEPARIAIVTDAWAPQVNGVVRTLAETSTRLRTRGHRVEMLTPDQFPGIPMPFYREIKLAFAPGGEIARRLALFRPDIVHIATEGPLGWSARRWCRMADVPFTTAFHTRFPDYAAVRTRLSPEFFWPAMRRFHAPSRMVLAATPTLRRELAQRGIGPTAAWTRGIDRDQFHANVVPDERLRSLPGPILMAVGRVAPEKGLEAFLSCDVPGTKVVVGDGPALIGLKKQFPLAVFTGALSGPALASAYAAADCLVFPSRSDTFGLVMAEALACGVPVAAFPVAGPVDIVGPHGLGPADMLRHPIGALNEDLSAAIAAALSCRRDEAAQYGATFDWDIATDQFVAALHDAMAGEHRFVA